MTSRNPIGAGPERIGVVGLGRMGGAIARHVKEAGYTVFGLDPDAAASARAQAAGIEIARTAAELGALSEIVFITVGYDSELEQVVMAPDGLLSSMRAGGVIGVMSTVSPEKVVELAQRCGAASVRVLDLPMCRGEDAAERGDLLLLGAGDKPTFERCRPIFGAFASAVTYLGEAGAGQVAKIANNMIFWACLAANNEAKMLAKAWGIDEQLLRDALVQSSANNWALETGVTGPWAEKDMTLALAEANRLRLSLPLGGVVREVVRAINIERENDRSRSDRIDSRPR